MTSAQKSPSPARGNPLARGPHAAGDRPFMPLRAWECDPSPQVSRPSRLDAALSRPGPDPDAPEGPATGDASVAAPRIHTAPPVAEPAPPPTVPADDLAAIVEASTDLIYRSDPAGRLVYLNRAGRSALGLGPGDPLDGLTLTSLHSPEDSATLRDRILPVAIRDGSWSGDLGVALADGAVLHASLALQAHRDASGSLRGFSATLRDHSAWMGRIARAEEAKATAEAESRAKIDLLARMSHELRTPLTSILGFVDYLIGAEEAGKPAVDRPECLNLIRRNGFYLVDLLNDLLDLSKLELGTLVPVRSACSPLAVAGEVAALLGRRASEKQLSLDVMAIGPLPDALETDPLRLRQILINLVGNAVKFTERGGVRVELGLECQGPAERLRVDVIDTGPGLTADQVARLGEAFYQGDPARPRDELGGTGLGLSICRQLAERLGGTIEVESEPGRGSRFRLLIPVSRPGETTAELAGGPGLAAFGEAGLDCRILLAEDVASSRRAISACLELAGAEVVAVGNGRDAVEAALAAERAGTPFDVVLLDIQMPVVDGPGAVRALRDRGYARAILALTADASGPDRREYLALGCDGCVSKPIDWNILMKMIRESVA